MNRWQRVIAEDKLDVEQIDQKKLIFNLKQITAKLGLSFRNVVPEIRLTFTNVELVFRFGSPSIVDVNGSTKLYNFDVIIQNNGDIVVNASNKDMKHLVDLNRVGNVKTLNNLYDRRGLFQKQIEFAIKTIKDNLETE